MYICCTMNNNDVNITKAKFNKPNDHINENSI